VAKIESVGAVQPNSYNIKLFGDDTIREWLATLDSIFRDLVADPSREVLDLVRLKAADASLATEVVYLPG
jgi:hypothetical protein